MAYKITILTLLLGKDVMWQLKLWTVIRINAFDMYMWQKIQPQRFRKPQGIYYLKLAYGYDWMSFVENGEKIGKFTRNVSYERSQDTFDFGMKNSIEERNFSLEINVVDSKLENNFLTTPINEEEFLK